MSNENSSPAEQKAALRCYPIDQWYEFALPAKAPNGSPGPMRDVYEAVVQMVFEAWQACYEPLTDRDAFIETMVISLSRSTGMAIGKILYHEANLNISSPSFLSLVIEARDQASRVLGVCESIRDERDADLNPMERMAVAQPFDPYALIPPLRKALTDYIARTANATAFPTMPVSVDQIADPIASLGNAAELVRPTGEQRSEYEFRLENKYYIINFEGESGILRPLVAVTYLHKIIGAAGRSLTIADLRVDTREKIKADMRIRDENVLDKKAFAAIRKRLEEIEDLEDSTGGSESLAEEKCELLKQLADGARLIKSSANRTAETIQRQLRDIWDKFDEAGLRSTRQHLESSITWDGYFVTYKPAKFPNWKT